MKKCISMVLAAAVVASVAVGGACRKKSSTEVKKPVYAFVINVPGRFWDLAHAGCQQAAREEGAEVDFQVPGQSSAAQQKQIVESLVAKGCSGLAISPLNPESIARLLDEVAKYMPVICQDSDAPQSKRVRYIGTDNVGAGRVAGEELKKVLPEGGEVAVFVGKMDVANAKERFEGVRQALEGSNCKIIEVLTDEADRTRAQSNARTALAKYPNLKGMVGLWGYNAPACVMALKDFPKHTIKVVGFDEDIETLEAVRRGELVCSVAQNPYEFGYQSIKMLARLHRGEKVEIPADKMIYVPVRVINKETVNAIEKDINEKIATLNQSVKLY